MWPKINLEDLELCQPFNELTVRTPIMFFFDVGSVLIDLDWDSYKNALQDVCNIHGVTLSQFLENMNHSQLTQKWSVGEIGPWAYFLGFKKCLADPNFEKVKLSQFTFLNFKGLSSLIVGPVRLRCKRLVMALRNQGALLGILSNATPWHEGDIESTLSLRDIFDVVCFSQDFGCEKPDFLFYNRALEAAQPIFYAKTGKHLTSENVYFLDDTPTNVRAAIACGWNARLVLQINEGLLLSLEAARLESNETLLAQLSQKLVEDSTDQNQLAFGDAVAKRVERLILPLLEPWNRG